MVLSSIFFPGMENIMIYPMAICSACILTSIAGTYFVRLGKNGSIMGALYKGFIASAILSLVVLYFVTDYIIGLEVVYQQGEKTFTGLTMYICGIIGLLITGLIIWITEYYTVQQ